MMPSQPIADRLKTHLSRVGADIVHAASTRVPPDGLNILIDRAPLSFPIGEDDIAALISIAEPAHFGSGEDTVFDPTVRDTWVIDPAHVHLGDPTGAAGTDNWTGALNESLAASVPRWEFLPMRRSAPNSTRCSSMGRGSSSCRIRTRRRTTRCWPHSW